MQDLESGFNLCLPGVSKDDLINIAERGAVIRKSFVRCCLKVGEDRRVYCPHRNNMYF